MWLGTLLIPLFFLDTKAAGPFDYNIHEFTGHCDPDGTCRYVLQIPSHEALQNPGVMDNRTASAILKHLERHDHQLLQLLGYFGKSNSSSSATNLLKELKDLTEENKKLNNMVQVLIGDAASLAQKNKYLQSQFDHLNKTLHGKIILAGGDFCASKPCHNKALCQNLNERYVCICLNGYIGNNCETDINECDPNPCQYGKCQDGQGDYTCVCENGFTGKNCSVNIDECANHPCGIGGVCIDGVARYHCLCDPGFSGATCEINVDECASNPCKNGGFCLDDVNSFFCACPPGYTGELCDKDFDECQAANPCLYGTCINQKGNYSCNCTYPEITGKLCDETPESNCWDLKKYQNQTKDSTYSIDSPAGGQILARCDMSTDNGGWLIFLRRYDGAVNFNKTWNEYKYGFGELSGDFWWGNELLHTFTSAKATVMRVDMWDWKANHAYALYDSFLVDDETHNYTIHVGNYSGDAGDPFHFNSNRFSQDNMPFSTYDRDNDPYNDNCARVYSSGFWYNQCWAANPTGKYYNSGSYTTRVHDGVEWWTWQRDRYSLRAITMSFRPKGVA
ncbi:slit homolog 3 protein-like [Gigantopelta aegis]|uniref:slit homolog 3 protein-like n=1 Tax=Gigantopelta aegis TaxID=1735272 RepID=UPI001B88B117|nr:slit homolog 3 protein-like [Gigantopelta aegis]